MIDKAVAAVLQNYSWRIASVWFEICTGVRLEVPESSGRSEAARDGTVEECPWAQVQELLWHWLCYALLNHHDCR
jgi:hypothetical protein